MNLEEELRLALKREEPVKDFSLAYARGGSRAWRGIAAAAAIAALLPAGIAEYRIYQRRQTEGRIAKEKLILAIQVASVKLHRTRQLLRKESI